jgi:hypothetical protein
MQWYLTDKRRLKAEIRLMEQNGVNFELCVDGDENLLWRGSFYVSNQYHGDVRLVYDEIHPYKQMTVYILDPPLPHTNLHVHSDWTICYIRENEWSPEWTAFAVYLTTIRFLNDYYSGNMIDHIPYQVYVPREKSIFEKITDAIFS